MTSDSPSACNELHPDQPQTACDRSPHPYGPHFNRASGLRWDGKPQPPPPSKRPKGSRAKEVADLVIGSGATQVTGPPNPLEARPGATSDPLRPWEREWERRRPDWLKEARSALQQVARTHEKFMGGDVWLLVDDVPERRAMSLVVRYGLNNHWMREDSARRVTEEWRTRDGVTFPLNKLCPVYASLIYQA